MSRNVNDDMAISVAAAATPPINKAQSDSSTIGFYHCPISGEII